VCLANRYGYISIQAQLAKEFDVGEPEIGGLLATFYIPFLISTFVIGVIGDLYSRKKIIVLCLLLEALAVFSAAYSQTYRMFVVSRMLLGIVTAPWITLAPTVISDLYKDDERTKMISIFLTSSPLGIGVGYMIAPQLLKNVGSILGFKTAIAFGGVLDLILFIFHWLWLPDVPRTSESPERIDTNSQNWLVQKLRIDDLKALLSIKTYVLVGIAASFCNAFVEVGFTWTQEYCRRKFITLDDSGIKPCKDDFIIITNPIENDNSTLNNEKFVDGIPGNQEIEATAMYQQQCASSEVSFSFGLISVVCGFSGVVIGMIGVKLLNSTKLASKSRPLISGLGAFIASITIFAMIWYGSSTKSGTWVYVFIALLTVAFHFGLAPDMIYRICPSNKRALATAVFVGFERCFGTTFPPYLAGLVTENYQERYKHDFISDPSKYSEKDWFNVRFKAIEAALYSIAIYALISTFFWLVTAFFCEEDERKLAEKDRNEEMKELKGDLE